MNFRAPKISAPNMGNLTQAIKPVTNPYAAGGAPAPLQQFMPGAGAIPGFGGMEQSPQGFSFASGGTTPTSNISDTKKFPAGGDVPRYNPYVDADGGLEQVATYTPKHIMEMDFNPLFGRARSDLSTDLRNEFSASQDSMLSQGGLDNGARERMATSFDLNRSKAMGRLSGDQAIQEAQHKFDVNRYNVGSDNDARQFNIGTMLGENRFASAADLDRFKTEMGVKGAEMTAQAMERYANSAPKNPIDTNWNNVKEWAQGFGGGQWIPKTGLQSLGNGVGAIGASFNPYRR